MLPLPPSILYQASPILQSVVCGSREMIWFLSSLWTHCFRPFVHCCRDQAWRASALPPSDQAPNFDQFSLPGDDTWLSVALHKYCHTLAYPWFHSKGGSPEHLVGVDLAEGLPEIELHMVCHSSMCLLLLMQIMCASR